MDIESRRKPVKKQKRFRCYSFKFFRKKLKTKVISPLIKGKNMNYTYDYEDEYSDYDEEERFQKLTHKAKIVREDEKAKIRNQRKRKQKLREQNYSDGDFRMID